MARSRLATLSLVGLLPPLPYSLGRFRSLSLTLLPSLVQRSPLSVVTPDDIFTVRISAVLDPLRLAETLSYHTTICFCL